MPPWSKKNINQEQVRATMGGEAWTAKELLKAFGYAATTYVRDTAFYQFLKDPESTNPMRWRAL